MVTLGNAKRALTGLVPALALLMTALLLCSAVVAVAAENERPLVLVFESVAGDGITKDLAASATRAVRTYFRETHRAEAVIVSADSPTVLRAVMDKKLTLESLTNGTSRERRLEIAKILGFEYAAAAELSVKKDLEAVLQVGMPKPPKGKQIGRDAASTVKADFVQAKVWLSKVDGGKREQWDATQPAMYASTKPLDMDNAMQSAVSAAVLDLTKKAFADVVPTDVPVPSTGNESVAIAPEMPTGTAPTAEDYSTEADDSIEAGNIALAIQQYSQAVSADPSNGKLRARLAEAYARKGLYAEANEELDRALRVGIDKAIVDASRAKIAQMQAGSKPAMVPEPAPTPAPEPKIDLKIEPATTPVTPASTSTVTVIPAPSRDAVAQAIARMQQGDQLWAKSQPDDAALAYTEAVRLNPGDWRSYERLAAVNASLSLFGEARKSLEQLKIVQPDPSSETIARRYDMFHKAFDKAFAMLLTQMDTDTADFDKKIITRESYYATINGLGLRLDAMNKFLASLTVPAAKQPANLRRSLACGLIAQAAANMQDYLETNNKKSRTNAELFIEQAKKESEAAAKLEANQIIVSKDGSGPSTRRNNSAQSAQPNQQPQSAQAGTVTPTVPQGLPAGAIIIPAQSDESTQDETTPSEDDQPRM